VNYLTALRTFFRDLQEWEIIPRRFDPIRTFATPNSLRALVGIQPRIIADDIWAKLVWAGLNLMENDLPRRPTKSRPTQYPIEMVRAFVITWLFAALRMNEILRLRVGCIRWQREGVIIPETGDSLAADAVCFIDIPVNKTSTEYTKPVDRVVGEAIAAWERVRPAQVKRLDPKNRGKNQAKDVKSFRLKQGSLSSRREPQWSRLLKKLVSKRECSRCAIRRARQEAMPLCPMNRFQCQLRFVRNDLQQGGCRSAWTTPILFPVLKCFYADTNQARKLRLRELGSFANRPNTRSADYNMPSWLFLTTQNCSSLADAVQQFFKHLPFHCRIPL
jgi:hypothetical protein